MNQVTDGISYTIARETEITLKLGVDDSGKICLSYQGEPVTKLAVHLENAEGVLITVRPPSSRWTVVVSDDADESESAGWSSCRTTKACTSRWKETAKARKIQISASDGNKTETIDLWNEVTQPIDKPVSI